MKNKCYENRKHCEKRRKHLLQAISAFPLHFLSCKRSNVRLCLRNKIFESWQVSFFHVFYPAFILNSLGKGYVLSKNARDEGAEGYYGQLRLVMLYSCFNPLPRDFILTLSQTTNVRLPNSKTLQTPILNLVKIVERSPKV